MSEPCVSPSLRNALHMNPSDRFPNLYLNRPMFKHVYVMVIVILSKSCFFVHVDSFVVSNKPNDGKRFIRSLGKVVFAFNALYWICQSDSSI